MATTSELAQALVSVFRTTQEPDPLPVDFWNEGPAEVMDIVRSVIERCDEEQVLLVKVAIDPAFARGFSTTNTPDTLSYKGIPIVGDATLRGRIEFYRGR